MNLVLYSAEDLSPITIIPVPMWAMDMLEARQRVVFAVPGPIFLAPAREISMIEKIVTVTVWAEPIWRGKAKSLMLFTDMDAEALGLRPAYLPGQVKDVQRRENGAFLRGLFAALGGMDP